MPVPLNGALGRLLCKFSVVVLLLLVLLWSISRSQKSASEVQQLEAQLRFCQDQLSSLHAQIDVVSRHKEKIEVLLREEGEQHARNRQDFVQQISGLENENRRLIEKNEELVRSQNVRMQNVAQQNNNNNSPPLDNMSAKNEQIPAKQAPNVKKSEMMEERVEKRADEDDPFEIGGNKIGQAQREQIMEPPNLEKEKEEGEGEEAKLEQAKEEEEEEKDREEEEGKEEDGKEVRNNNMKHKNNGGEREEEIFQRDRPKVDLVFWRKDGEEEEGNGKRNGNGSAAAKGGEPNGGGGRGGHLTGRQLVDKLADQRKEGRLKRKRGEEKREEGR